MVAVTITINISDRQKEILLSGVEVLGIAELPELQVLSTSLLIACINALHERGERSCF